MKVSIHNSESEEKMIPVRGTFLWALLVCIGWVAFCMSSNAQCEADHWMTSFWGMGGLILGFISLMTPVIKVMRTTVELLLLVGCSGMAMFCGITIYYLSVPGHQPVKFFASLWTGFMLFELFALWRLKPVLWPEEQGGSTR